MKGCRASSERGSSLTFGFRIADNHLKAHRCERSEMSNGLPPEKDRLRLLQAMGLVLQLGLTLAAIAGGSAYLGVLVDRKAGTGWIFTASFSFFGIMASFYTLYKMVMRASD